MMLCLYKHCSDLDGVNISYSEWLCSLQLPVTPFCAPLQTFSSTLKDNSSLFQPVVSPINVAIVPLWVKRIEQKVLMDAIIAST